MSDPKNLFWDSCVFIRYLSAPDGAECLDDIIRFVEDKGGPAIHYSSLVLAEIRPRFFKGSKYGTIQGFFADLGSRFIQIEPNPNIMIAAGELRDAKSTNPFPKEPKSREFGTPDAIHLMTCLYARDVLGIRDIVFHTLDEGKGKNWEGRCIPLLAIERWFPEATRTERVKEVCGLLRSKPLHLQLTLTGMVAHGRRIDVKPSDQDRPN